MLLDILAIIGSVIWFFVESALYMVIYPICFIRSLFGFDDPSFADVIRTFPIFFLRFLSLLAAYSAFLFAVDPRGTRGSAIRLVAWLHYFFVPHPAEAMIKEATRHSESQPIDMSQFAKNMKRKMSLNPDDHPTGYKSENQTKKAEALAALLAADRKLMEAVKEREEARRKTRNLK